MHPDEYRYFSYQENSRKFNEIKSDIYESLLIMKQWSAHSNMTLLHYYYISFTMKKTDNILQMIYDLSSYFGNDYLQHYTRIARQ